jgi:hypothetical protein
LAKLNAEFHFWRGVQDVAGQTAERQTGQQGPLSRILYPALGATAGLEHFGDPAHTIMEAAGLALVNEIIHNPGYRTLSAISKNELANALARGDVQKVASIATRLGAGAASQPHSDIGFVNDQDAVPK